MAHQDVAFDPERFSHTASLFAFKRTIFTARAVERLADDVLRRLAATANCNTEAEIPAIDPIELSDFCDALITPSAEASWRFIETRREQGVTRMGVYMGYICAAARYLGKEWEDDRLSFMDVTIGTGHLYAIMRALRAERSDALAEYDARRSAMFATVPGEDHGIGTTVAADYFREKGWDIDLQIGSDYDALLDHVQRTQPRIVGLSLSTEDRLDTLARLVVATRIIVPQAVIGVAPASGLDADQIRRLLDVDILFGSAETAYADLERRLTRRG